MSFAKPDAISLADVTANPHSALANRSVWIAMYHHVSSPSLGGPMSQTESPSTESQYGEMAVYFDAATGEFIQASIL